MPSMLNQINSEYGPLLSAFPATRRVLSKNRYGAQSIFLRGDEFKATDSNRSSEITFSRTSVYRQSIESILSQVWSEMELYSETIDYSHQNRNTTRQHRFSCRNRSCGRNIGKRNGQWSRNVVELMYRIGTVVKKRKRITILIYYSR